MKQTNEEFMAHMKKLVNDFAEWRAEKAKKAEEENVPFVVAPLVVPKGCPTPMFNNQYEQLHFYDLDTNERESGAIYDGARWRYHYCQEPYPWVKCWHEDYAD